MRCKHPGRLPRGTKGDDFRMKHNSIEQKRPQDPKMVPFHRLREENGTLIATRYAKPEHLLQKPLAWAYNVEVIEAMQAAGVHTMEVIYSGKVFSCPLRRFLAYARRMNRGYGEQLFLPLEYWSTRRAEEPEPTATIRFERRKPKLEQATLF